VTSIVNIAAPGKKNFAPGKVMLHNQGALLSLFVEEAPRLQHETDPARSTRAQTRR